MAAPNNKKSINMALSGSGFLCPAEAGALVAVHDAGMEVKSLVGTSGGAIVAAFYAVHRNPYLLEQIIKNTDWSNLMDFDSWYNPIRFFTSGGICGATALHKFLLKHTMNLTFGELDFDLKITATDEATGKLKIFSREETPKIKIADAARASSAIPFIYPSMMIDNIAYMDGGLSLNLPAVELDKNGLDSYCVYLKGTEGTQTYGDPGLIHKASLCINAFMKNGAKLDKLAATNVKFVEVYTGNLSALNSSMSNADKMHLIQAGYEAMKVALIK